MERNRAVLESPSAVKPSTNTYWKLSGMISSVNTWIPQVERDTRDGSSVKIRIKYTGTILDSINITVVKQRQRSRIYFSAFFTLSTAFAP